MAAIDTNKIIALHFALWQLGIQMKKCFQIQG
jgi:hypothetical protein